MTKECKCSGCYRERINSCALLRRDLFKNTHRNVDTRPKNCPCMMCLIKVICNIQCDERDEFWCNEYDRIWNITARES